MHNTITEMKNTLEAIKSSKNEAEEWISELEDRMVKITTTEQNTEIRMKRMGDRQVDTRQEKKSGMANIIPDKDIKLKA